MSWCLYELLHVKEVMPHEVFTKETYVGKIMILNSTAGHLLQSNTFSIIANLNIPKNKPPAKLMVMTKLIF